MISLTKIALILGIAAASITIFLFMNDFFDLGLPTDADQISLEN